MKYRSQVEHHLVIQPVHSVDYRVERLGVSHGLDYISELVAIHAAVIKE